jgi:nitrate reductase NapAB chaperone NapD
MKKYSTTLNASLQDEVERLKDSKRNLEARLLHIHIFNDEANKQRLELDALKQRLSEAPKCEIRLCDDQIYRITLIDIERNYKFYNKVALVELTDSELKENK